MNTLLETTPSDFQNSLSNRETYFIRDIMLCVRIGWDCWSSTLFIQDITSAGKVGKTCKSIRAEFKNVGHNTDEGFKMMHAFIDKRGCDLKKIYDELVQLPYPDAGIFTPSIEMSGVIFTLGDEKGTRTYSPYATYAPLTSAPAKWTLSHAIRALWNGQYESLTCDGHYTDDYAFDAAENFGKGAIKNARAFCKQIIESPSGWRTYENGGSVSVCCHTFNCNSFRPVLAHVVKLAA